MKIYVCHSSVFDYKKDLYKPIRKSILNKKYEFVLPHEISDNPFNSKDIISECDLIISETSFPSTSMGIELGWANKENKRILFIYKKGIKISKSLQNISSDFIEYLDTKDLIKKLELFFNKLLG
jgi:hypothetical protein